ncbi:MAG: hypothetical protein ACQETV_08330, partial [Actinomycetota bacterium]
MYSSLRWSRRRPGGCPDAADCDRHYAAAADAAVVTLTAVGAASSAAPAPLGQENSENPWKS